MLCKILSISEFHTLTSPLFKIQFFTSVPGLVQRVPQAAEVVIARSSSEPPPRNRTSSEALPRAVPPPSSKEPAWTERQSSTSNCKFKFIPDKNSSFSGNLFSFHTQCPSVYVTEQFEPPETRFYQEHPSALIQQAIPIGHPHYEAPPRDALVPRALPPKPSREQLAAGGCLIF